MQNHSCLSLSKYCGMRKQEICSLAKSESTDTEKKCSQLQSHSIGVLGGSMLWPLDRNIDLLGHCIASIFSTARTFWFKLTRYFMFVFAELCWNQNQFSTASTLRRKYVTERVLAVTGKNFERATTLFTMQALLRKSLQKAKKKECYMYRHGHT